MSFFKKRKFNGFFCSYPRDLVPCNVPELGERRIITNYISTLEIKTNENLNSDILI